MEKKGGSWVFVSAYPLVPLSFLRQSSGGGVKFHALIIECINECNEAFCLIPVLSMDHRNIIDHECAECFRNLEKIERAECGFAQIIIREPRDAMACERHMHGMAFDGECNRMRARMADEIMKNRIKR